MIVGVCPSLAADPCPPSAVVTGDDEIVRTLFEAAPFSDISQTALPGCPAVWVKLTRRAASLFVQIEDHLGRRYERSVGDIDTAAMLIESWARGDALMSVLPTIEPSTQTASAAEERAVAMEPVPAAETPTKGKDCPASADAPSSQDVTVGAGFEFSLGADRSSWFGGIARWCTRLAMTCLGTVIRGAADPMLTGDMSHLTDIRARMDVILAISIPIAISRVRLSPLVGIGAGWVQTSKGIEETDDETKVFESSFGGVRLELDCLVAVKLVQGLYLDLGVGLTTSFIAEEKQVTIDGEAMAGEPRDYVHFSLGVSYRWS